jgi:hypothetical protein
MSFILYSAPQSTCSQRVRFVLNAKTLPFEEKKLDLLAGDQLKPDYLALNPNGVVPTLDHDGTIIIDSSDRGREGFGPPRPPNRTGGFPAYGSPVGGFLIGSVSRSARPCEVRAALLARRMRWANVDGPLDSVRSRGVFPVCAGANAAVCGSFCRCG